jgi:hypothetical protein
MTSMFWHVCAGFPFALAQTEIDSSVTSEFFDTIKHFGFRNLSFGVSFQRRQVWGFYRSCWTYFFGVQWGDEPSRSELLLRHFVITSVCYAINVNLIKRFLSDLSPLSITTGNFAVLLLPASLILFYRFFLR